MPKRRFEIAGVSAVLKWLWPYLRGHELSILLLVPLAGFMAVSAGLYGYGTKYLVDALTEHRSTTELWIGIGILGAHRVFARLSATLYGFQEQKVLNQFAIRLQSRVFEKLLVLPTDVLYRSGAGVAIQQVLGESRTVQSGLASLSGLIQVVVQIAGVLAVAFSISAFYPVVILFFIMIPRFLLARPMSAIKERARASSDLSAELNQVLIESVRSMRMIRVLRAEGIVRDRFVGKLEELWSLSRGLMYTQSGLNFIRLFATLTGFVIVLAYFGMDVLAGRQTAGSLVAFIAIINQISSLGLDLVNQHFFLYRTENACQRISELLEAAPSVSDSGTRRLDGAIREVEFADVRFSYPGSSAAVLKGVNLKLRSGEIVLLSGESGIGKSTLINLLIRIADPAQGAVKINGVDVREYTLSSLREHISFVGQEFGLFGGTIAENIRMAKPGATLEEVRRAALLAGADEFISRTSHGYDTQLGEDAGVLSQGQKQRIAIARAFLKDAPVLLLDEPTSALDPKSADTVRRSLEALMENRITFVVTHRADEFSAHVRVVRLQDGVIAPEAVTRVSC